ncbi:MAG: RNA polymerase sigma-70 factor [Rhodothermales bacterium]|nr:RNA polymerase sigma-70 factor [Rhodothermales bacterium]
MAELAGRIRSSDPDAYADAYNQLKGPLIRYIQRFISDTSASYDVLQDVFLKLWEQRSSMRDDTNLKALLYTMARNRSLNVIRKESRQADIDTDVLFELTHSDDSIDANLEHKVLREHVTEWLGKLPPRRAEAFMLSRFHDLKYSEVASIMKLSERTVQTHVLHALRDLRAKLSAFRQEQ